MYNSGFTTAKVFNISFNSSRLKVAMNNPRRRTLP